MRRRQVTRWLGLVLAVGYLLAGIIGAAADIGDSTGDNVAWATFLCGGAVLVLLGLYLLDRSPWAGGALVAIGAIGGAFAVFWTLIVPVLAAVLAALALSDARARSRATV